jgi:hypothetical protein
LRTIRVVALLEGDATHDQQRRQRVERRAIRLAEPFCVSSVRCSDPSVPTSSSGVSAGRSGGYVLYVGGIGRRASWATGVPSVRRSGAGRDRPCRSMQPSTTR